MNTINETISIENAFIVRKTIGGDKGHLDLLKRQKPVPENN